MEAKAKTAMVCLSEGMTLTTNITQMSNFQYTDSNRFIEGTSFDDRIMLQQGIAGGNNGFIDGGSGFDTFYIQESSSDWNLVLNDAEEVSFLSSTRSTHNGSGSINNPAYELSIQIAEVERIVFNDKTIDLNTSTSNTNAGGGNEIEFNEIYGTKRADELIGTGSADYIWGSKGDDMIYGGAGDDLIVGGKGLDVLEGGSGEDWFGVNKKFGKGKNNFDVIVDFEVGTDVLMVEGSTKGLWIDNFEGDAVLVRGKKDIIAWVDGAGGQLDWGGSDGSLIL